MNAPRFCTTFLFAIIIHAGAFGQTQGSQDNSLLPEINPQDIEIRSDFRARFPGLRRQPILGFNPKPRVYQIDPNRKPFMETPEEAVAGVEMAELDRPEGPQHSYLAIPNRGNIFLKTGIGSLLSPEIAAYAANSFNNKEVISAELNFNSAAGHLPQDDGAYRTLDLQAQYTRSLSNNRKLQVQGGMLSDHFDLFNAGLPETPEKTNSGARVAIALSQSNNAFMGSEIHLGGTLFSSEIPSAQQTAPCVPFCYGGKLFEKTYFAGYEIKWPGAKMYEVMKISARLEGGNAETDLASENWMHAGAAFSYEKLFNFRTRVSGSGGMAYVKDARSAKLYIAPKVEVNHYLTEHINLSGKAYAMPRFEPMQAYHQFNRFLDTGNNLRHAYTTGVEGEVAYRLIEGNAIFGGVSFNYTKDYAYYQRASDGANRIGFYEIDYGQARIFELYFGITQQLVPEKFWFDARLYARNHSLSNGDDIPYQERVGFEGALAFRPVHKFTVKSWANYVGKRNDTASPDDLKAFVLLNGSAEYQINSTFGLYAKVLNILGQKYEIWNGYEERPFQIFGGITFRF